MNLDEIRKDIDKIDEDIMKLFTKRMTLAKDVAEYKLAHDMAINNPKREAEILEEISALAEEGMERYARILFNTLFDVSKSYQGSLMTSSFPLRDKINYALENTPKTFPTQASVACQGVAGSYSQGAAERLFEFPKISYFNNFEAIFKAVESGLCQYGILPIENSSFGSVSQIYDLMKTSNFSIVKSAKLKISHKLVANPGTALGDVKEIYSHPQAIGQCSSFLKELKDVKITEFPNTAMAAKAVAQSGRADLAAISSKQCCDLYGLHVLEENVQLTDHNYTRFICISKNLDIYPGSNKISVMLSLPHKAMSLYHTLAKFSALGINMTKLESRPIPGSDFEFMFYFDMEASMYREDVVALLCQLDRAPETFVFLGAYSEI